MRLATGFSGGLLRLSPVLYGTALSQSERCGSGHFPSTGAALPGIYRSGVTLARHAWPSDYRQRDRAVTSVSGLSR